MKEKAAIIQKLESDLFRFGDACEKLTKEVKLYEDKLQQSENTIRNKQSEINSLL